MLNQREMRESLGAVRDASFAVEIECGIPRSQIARSGWRVGSYHRGTPIPGHDYNGKAWTIENDSSLHSGTMQMVEIVSPPLRGRAGLASLRRMMQAIKAMGGKVNKSCGLHVNISHPKMFTPKRIKRLINIHSKFELALYSSNGNLDRVSPDHGYCRSVKSDGGYAAPQRRDRLANVTSLNQLRDEAHTRYMTLNLQHITARLDRRRVEFRVFGPSLNPTKATAFICVALGMVEAAMDYGVTIKNTVWDLDKAQSHREWTDGIHAMHRLFDFLRWVPRQAERDGVTVENVDRIAQADALKARGILDGSPAEMADDINRSRNELFRLAEKFDRATLAAQGGTQAQRDWIENWSDEREVN
jgi:hypothetical protein